jgi:hypothetical protein
MIVETVLYVREQADQDMRCKRGGKRADEQNPHVPAVGKCLPAAYQVAVIFAASKKAHANIAILQDR